MPQTRRTRSGATPQKDTPISTLQKEEGFVKTELATVLDTEAGNVDGGDAILVGNKEGDTCAPDSSGSSKVAGIEAADDAADGIAVENPAEDANAVIEVAQQDVAAVAAPSASGVIELNCQVCNCSFTNYHEHMNSKSHRTLRNQLTGKTEASAEASISSPIMQGQKRSGGALDTDVSAPNPKKFKSQEGDQEIYECNVCNLKIARKQDFEHHMNGKRHHMAAQKAQGKSHCERCYLFFDTSVELSTHLDSQLHKNNIADKKPENVSYFCDVCKVSSYGDRQRDQHLGSKRHKRMLKIKETVNSKTSEDSAANGKKNSDSITDVLKKWLYACNACEFYTDDDGKLMQHIGQSSHKAAAAKLKQAAPQQATSGNNTHSSGKAPVNQNGSSKPPPIVTASTVKTAARVPTDKTGPVVTGNNAKSTSASIYNAQVNRTPATNSNIMQNNNATPKKTLSKPNSNQSMKFPGNVDANKVNNRSGGFGKQLPGGNANPSLSVSNAAFSSTGNQNLSFKAGHFEALYDSFRSAGPFAGARLQQIDDFRVNYRNNIREEFRPDYSNTMRDGPRPEIVNSARGEFFGDSSRKEILRDLRDDIRGDLRGDIRGDIRGDLRSDIRRDLRDDIRGDLRNDIRSDLQSDFRGDLRGETRGEIRSDMRGNYRDWRRDFLQDSRGDLRGEFPGESRSEWRDAPGGIGNQRSDFPSMERIDRRTDCSGDYRGYGSLESSTNRDDFHRPSFGGNALGTGYRGNSDEMGLSDGYSRLDRGFAFRSGLSGHYASSRPDPAGDRNFLSGGLYNTPFSSSLNSSGYMSDVTHGGR